MQMENCSEQWGMVNRSNWSKALTIPEIHHSKLKNDSAAIWWRKKSRINPDLKKIVLLPVMNPNKVDQSGRI